MDLTIQLDGSVLNIRVAVIMETQKGFLLEKNKKGFYFFAGGRVKIGESSLQSAKREIFEETGLDISEFDFVSTIENFFDDRDGSKKELVHEICFVYKTNKVDNVDPKYGLYEFSKEEIVNMDIRPEKIKELILNEETNKITHHIV